MPHELKGLPNLSHDALTLILVGGVASAAVFVSFILFLNWRHRRGAVPDNKQHNSPPGARRRKKKRR